MNNNLLAASMLLGSIGVAHADVLKPIQAQSIDLLGISGTAYYTVREDGFHLVATVMLSEALEQPPLRVQAVLRSGQSVTFSAPGTVDGSPVTLEFSRQEDQLVVQKRTRGIDLDKPALVFRAAREGE